MKDGIYHTPLGRKLPLQRHDLHSFSKDSSHHMVTQQRSKYCTSKLAFTHLTLFLEIIEIHCSWVQMGILKYSKNIFCSFLESYQIISDTIKQVCWFEVFFSPPLFWSRFRISLIGNREEKETINLPVSPGVNAQGTVRSKMYGKWGGVWVSSLVGVGGEKGMVFCCGKAEKNPSPNFN